MPRDSRNELVLLKCKILHAAVTFPSSERESISPDVGIIRKCVFGMVKSWVHPFINQVYRKKDSHPDEVDFF
jgi:hypothetical protein